MADPDTEPFPTVESATPAAPTTPTALNNQEGHGRAGTRRSRSTSTASAMTARLRGMSKDFGSSSLPQGFLQATGDLASSVLTLSDPAKRRQASAGSPVLVPPRNRAGTVSGRSPLPMGHGVDEGGIEEAPIGLGIIRSASSEKIEEAPPATSLEEASADVAREAIREDPAVPRRSTFETGYHFPPSYPKKESLKMGLVAFGHFALTPVGFLVVVYGLNVVAWGGMLFLLLCTAAPAMCHPTCGDINSPRRKWVEVDSQILNTLFCVTGFGLAPWRFRDWYYLLQYRILKKASGLRHLAAIHRGWLRLPGSEALPADIGPSNVEARRAEVPEEALPLPEKSIPDPPLTRRRASPTRLWKLDLVVWMNVCNTFLQAVLSGFMWGMTRYNRPSWATGLFVGLACSVAALAGLVSFWEGKRVKGIEGVPLTERDREVLARDKELGIPHYNNLADKPPKAVAAVEVARKETEEEAEAGPGRA